MSRAHISVVTSSHLSWLGVSAMQPRRDRWRNDSREFAIGRECSRHNNLVSGRSSGIETMMQPCASTAKLRVAGPFSTAVPRPCSGSGCRPSDRHRVRRAEWTDLVVRARPRPTPSGHRTQDDVLRCLAGGHQPPQRDQELPRKGHDHGLAGAAAAIRRPRPIPSRQATVLLEPEEAPS